MITANFNTNVDPDKIYLIQVSPGNNIKQLQINNAEIKGTFAEKNKIYNITEYIRQQNHIQLYLASNQETFNSFDIKLHRVNPMFIPVVSLELYEIENALKLLSVELKIKNAFNAERQGSLYFEIYTDDHNLVAQRETPVFIDGNAENLYHQQIDLTAINPETKALNVRCKLFSEGRLSDEYFSSVKMYKKLAEKKDK